MSKSNKNILLIVIAVVVLAIIIGLIVFSIKNKNTEKQEKTLTSKIYEKINNTNEITYTRTIDEKNKIVIILKGNQAYKEVTTNGKTKKYIVKNGDTYYLDDSEKNYYKYENNDEILTEMKQQFEEIDNVNLKDGKENINGKKYEYEEIQNFQGFLFDDKLSVNNLEYAKTRLYYKNGELSYIKTIVGDNQELMKVDISYENINNDYFEIPSGYTEV